MNPFSKVYFCLLLSALSACGIYLPEVSFDEHNRALALVDQGTGYLYQQEFDKAQASYEMAFELAHLAAALDGLGCIQFYRGDITGAEHLYQAALERDPEYFGALGNLALLYEQIGDLSAAEKHFIAALEAEPENFRVRNNYAIFLAERNLSSHLAADLDLSQAELKRAQALVDSPVIELNIKELEKR